jgi:hypothetical protein
MYIMTIKLQEATIKQFRSSTIQHSSDKHPEIILKPKGIIQKQVNSCHENSCPENTNIYQTTMLQTSSVTQLSTKSYRSQNRKKSPNNYQQLSRNH